jgi:hypothetical protein
MGVEQTVMRAARLLRVRRRVTGTRTGVRFIEGAETNYQVKLVVQPTSSKTLERIETGDKSGGNVDVWASLTNLAAAYEEDDLSHSALGWTELQIAPAEGQDGPRGDYVEWRGRVYEIVSSQNHDDGGLIPNSRIQRYSAADRGASS